MGYKKNVLFIANKCPHYRITLFNKLSKIMNVTFFFTNEDYINEKLKARYIISKGSGFRKLRAHFDIIGQIKNNKYDFVIMLPPDASHLIDNYLIYCACNRRNIPFIIWNERWAYFNTPFRDKISNFFHKFLLRRAHKVLVAGKQSKRWVLSYGVKRKNIVMAPNAREIYYNKNNMMKAKKYLIKKYNLHDKKIILYLGRLIKRKGLKYLINAFSEIKTKDVVLMIAGGGDYYNLGEKSVEYELKSQAKRLGIEDRVIFTGAVEFSDTPAYYSLADIFIYPSVTENISDPWGLCLNEAVQFGLPIISTDATGASYDLIKNGKNGFIVKEKSSEELRDRIEIILKDEHLKASMSNASKKIADKKNSYDNMLKGFLEALK